MDPPLIIHPVVLPMNVDYLPQSQAEQVIEQVMTAADVDAVPYVAQTVTDVSAAEMCRARNSNDPADWERPFSIPPLPLLCPPLTHAAMKVYGPRPARGNRCLIFFQVRTSSGIITSKNHHIFFHTPTSAAAMAATATGHNSMMHVNPLMHMSPSTLEWLTPWSNGVLGGSSAVPVVSDPPSSTFLFDTPMQFTMGGGELLDSWEQCISTMFRGEEAAIIYRTGSINATDDANSTYNATNHHAHAKGSVLLVEFKLVDFF